MRGEYMALAIRLIIKRGSPPLARGVLLISVLSTAQVRITPACAGSTGVNLFNDARRKDHPRLRGEYKDCTNSISPVLGSPPLARGVLNKLAVQSPLFRITPACAGSTRQKMQKRKTPPGSPPLAREVHKAAAICICSNRITPACAGSTTKS